MTQMWAISGLGLELMGSVLGMLLVGWFVDRWLGSSPRWTTVGAVVGLVGGGTNFIRKAMALNRAALAKYRREHPTARRAPADDPADASGEGSP